VTDRLLKFLFKAAPVRGGLVRIEDAWRQMVVLHDFPPVVTRLLGEMVAAGALLATSIKFNGALVMQVHGDGPVKLLVVECLPDLAIRATATLADLPIADGASMRDLINRDGRGRFAITLDPRDPMPGQQPYQGIVPLDGETMAEVLQAYMRQSEQLDTRLWLAASEHVSAGLLLQSLPTEGGTTGSSAESSDPDAWDRAVTLAHTITSEELLTLGTDDVLRRLFWQEPLEHYPAMSPHFACTCSRERIGRMLVSLGREEVDSIIDEQGTVTVTCDFCSRQYTFDAVDVTQLFTRGDTAQADAANRH
jgi:molecular chaperone Hsp33